MISAMGFNLQVIPRLDRSGHLCITVSFMENIT